MIVNRKYEKWRDHYDTVFADTCVARLGNGAWRWGSDPEHEYRDPPSPPLGMGKETWASLQRGLADAKAGRVVPHEDIEKEFGDEH